MSENSPEKTHVDVSIPPLAVTVHAQYTKDFSFENPGVPGTLRPSTSKTEMDVKIMMDAVKIDDGMNENLYETALTLNVRAIRDGKPVFIVELVYAALVSVPEGPAGQVKSILYVEIPQMLFPFARQIIANAVSNGGFPPFMLSPVDFRSMYAESQRSNKALDTQAAGTAH